jgi:hypothetical protein
MLNVKTAALENVNGTNIDIRDDLKLTGKNILDSEKVETKTIENINGTEIDIQDDLDLNNNNIINVNNINTTTINNQVPVFGGGGGSNGKYSQICLPPDSGQTSGNGQVIINGDNTDTNTAISLVDGNSIGSLIFTPSELSLGASYHIKIGGSISSDTKNMELNISAYLGSTLIYSTAINNQDIQIDDLKSIEYTYECDLDFTVNKIGTDGHIYSNGQVLYVTDRQNNNVRGSSSDKESSLDLSNNLTLDIKMKWETVANKMFRVTKMY